MNETGQFFTLEGIAASLLLLTTVIFIVSSGSLAPFSNNMPERLESEQIAFDALVFLDNLPPDEGSPTGAVTYWDQTHFSAAYEDLLEEAGLTGYYCSAKVIYRTSQGVESSQLINEPAGTFPTRSFSVARLVLLPDSFRKTVSHPPLMRNGRQVVRMEVVLWKA